MSKNILFQDDGLLVVRNQDTLTVSGADRTEVVYGYLDGFKLVKEETTEQDMWSTFTTIVFHHEETDTYWETTVERGSADMQEEDVPDEYTFDRILYTAVVRRDFVSLSEAENKKVVVCQYRNDDGKLREIEALMMFEGD